MQKIGAYLKSTREEKGHTFQEVSKSTKISPSVLRALEEDRLDNIDPVYLKGFLKLYCRFLGINWEEFLKEHPVVIPSAKPVKPIVKAPQPPQEVKEKKERPARQFSFNGLLLRNKKIIIIALSIIVALLFITLIARGCVVLVKKFPRKPRTTAAAKKAKSTPPKPKKAALPKTPVVKPKEAAPEKPKKLYPENVKSITAPPVATPPQIPAVVKEIKPKEITLVVKAQEVSYLKVKVDGVMVFQGTFRKGKAESWIAKDKIELSVGNAGGIALEVNEKVMPPLGRRGQSIKSILITSEGLKIL